MLSSGIEPCPTVVRPPCLSAISTHGKKAGLWRLPLKSIYSRLGLGGLELYIQVGRDKDTPSATAPTIHLTFIRGHSSVTGSRKCAASFILPRLSLHRVVLETGLNFTSSEINGPALTITLSDGIVYCPKSATCFNTIIMLSSRTYRYKNNDADGDLTKKKAETCGTFRTIKVLLGNWRSICLTFRNLPSYI